MLNHVVPLPQHGIYVLMRVKDQTEGGDSAAALDSKRKLMCF